MGEIPSIPTAFDGWIFRSRLEARWAVFFKELGIEFQYEPEGFALPGTNYLPDFYLPQVRQFAECKPITLTVEEKQKTLLLSDATNCPVLMLVGPPDFRIYDAVHPMRFEDGTLDRFECDYLLDIDWHDRKFFGQGRLYGCTGWERGVKLSPLAFTEQYAAAVVLARTFRFDEGGRF